MSKKFVKWTAGDRLHSMEKYFVLRKGDSAKVQTGIETDELGRQTAKVLVEVTRKVGPMYAWYAQTYTLPEFKKAQTGLDFINEATKHFWEVENGKSPDIKTLN